MTVPILEFKSPYGWSKRANCCYGRVRCIRVMFRHLALVDYRYDKTIENLN